MLVSSMRPHSSIDGPRLRREQIFPEGRIDGRGALVRGRERAKACGVGPNPFLEKHGVDCELAFKRRTMTEGRLTFHAQIGYRRLADSRRAYAEIHDRLTGRGWAPDRYGICLDWSMGYPKAERRGRPRGTGLVLDRPEDFAALTAMAPVAPHFGDFVLGMPGAVENTAAAIAAGATTIGNLSQYFTFRLPDWPDDVGTTLATVEALGLMAAQPVAMLAHSNLDDGYAAWFEDMASALGFAMIERRICEDLVRLPLGHCFGHTYSDPLKRLAFHIALAAANPAPGTMLYGNTTIYGADAAANYGALASYLAVDIMALRRRHSGHALTPIPVTEAQRIPTIEEVIDAHCAARRLTERMASLAPLLSAEVGEGVAETLLARGARFRDRILDALADGGIDVDDPAEMLLALRRIGPGQLERWYGEPATLDAPRIASPFVDEIETLADAALARIDPAARAAVGERRPKVMVATTDVHFYGKRLLETVFGRLGVPVLDGGVSVEPGLLAERAVADGAEAIAVSTYNGIALSFVQGLKAALSQRRLAAPIFVGGRLNEIMDDTGGSLPVEVIEEIRQSGATPCLGVEDLVHALADLPSGE
jgi:methylmalonyl-CoA mutase cobalamin-binding subunit